MARRRNGRLSRKSFTHFGNKIFPFVKAVSAPIAFLEQITAKDREINSSQMASGSTTTQFKILLNSVTGRLAGFGLFKSSVGQDLGLTPKQTINPAGVLNKWTNAGLIGIAYKVIGSAVNKMSTDMGAGNIVPETAKIGSIAKSVLIGGALGGFFDDPVTQQTQQPQIMSSPQIIRNTFNGSDSTESSF